MVRVSALEDPEEIEEVHRLIEAHARLTGSTVAQRALGNWPATVASFSRVVSPEYERIVRAGDYALTTLAAAVVQYFLTDEALTRESLTLLTGTLSAQLAEVLAAAKKKATDTETWKGKVSGPLRVTVSELVSGIERDNVPHARGGAR
jgi:chromosome condensin MukBEF complex kleisin-like MukF subunit